MQHTYMCFFLVIDNFGFKNSFLLRVGQRGSGICVFFFFSLQFIKSIPEVTKIYGGVMVWQYANS